LKVEFLIFFKNKVLDAHNIGQVFHSVDTDTVA